MAYGTVNGVENRIPDYTALVTAGKITTNRLTGFRADADAEIDAVLAEYLPIDDLPLASPPAIINTISDLLVTCFLMRFVYFDKDPAESAWVNQFCTEARDKLDDLKKSPEIFVDGSGNAIAETRVESTTQGQDRVFTDREDDGEVGGTTEDW